jgi:hypothetical protein
LTGGTAAGRVVAAPPYPFTSPDSPGGLDENDIVNHLADLEAVITVVINAGGTLGSFLYGIIRGGPLVAGHSDGADVADAVAANTFCHDPRVGAVEVLSGAELSSFAGQAAVERAVVAGVTADFWNAYLKDSLPGRAAIVPDGTVSTVSKDAAVPLAGTCPGSPAN